MRILLLCILCCFISMSAQAQKNNTQPKSINTSMLLLSQIGEFLYEHEVAATSKDSLGNYHWQFVLAEYGLRSKVNKEIAADLTTFLFNYNPQTNLYNGEVLRTKKGIEQERVLAMIYQQLRQNIRQYGSNIDFVRIDGQYFYVLYFPYEN